MVLRAGAGSLAALEELCGAYWFPVYAYLRRQGLPAEDAAEQSQEFFLGILKRGDLGRVERDGRRFRSWLYTAVRNHHLNVVKSSNRQRRQRVEVEDAEERFGREVAPGLNPEQVFARQWALSVLQSARDRVREEYERRGKGEMYAALAPTLTGTAPPHATLAEHLGISVGAVKTATHRLRQRFGVALREEVAEVVDSPEEIDDEIKILMNSLAGR